MMRIYGHMNISEWRQGKHHIRKAKRFYRSAQRLRKTASKDDAKKAEREQLIINAHNAYIDLAQSYVDKVRQTLLGIDHVDMMMYLRINQVQEYIHHAERQIDQIRRRVINGETIPHSEKVFSIFEPYTEWISEGKAGVPVDWRGFCRVVGMLVLWDWYDFIILNEYQFDLTILIVIKDL